MFIRGLIRTAELQEESPGSDRIELHLKVQGVKPDQPRGLVVPYSLLLEDEVLEAESVLGRGFEAEVEQDDRGRWVVKTLSLASKVLRSQD